MGLFDEIGKALGGTEGGLGRAIASQNRKKPGMACMVLCWVDDDRCKECLAEQEPIVRGIEELRRIENAIAHPEILNAASSVKFEKCTLCGAPYESGGTECLYCGTVYPVEVAAAADLPGTVGELRQLAINKAMEIQELYLPLYKKQLERLKNGSGLLSKGLFGLTGTMTNQTMAMSATQLQQGAQKYGVALSDYLCGVMNGSMESVSMTNFKEATSQYSEQQRQINERNMQRIDEQYQRQLQINEQRRQREMSMVNMRTPKYGGTTTGSSRTCYDCAYYSAGAGRCASTGKTTTAGNSCGRFKWK